MARRKRDPLADWANSLTPEQVKRLYQFIDPLTDEEQQYYDELSDDALLALLKE